MIGAMNLMRDFVVAVGLSGGEQSRPQERLRATYA